tara:strand:+ start:1079 stop:1957 length:879 start_codon:yes stop_codon:yes gene_type:complete
MSTALIERNERLERERWERERLRKSENQVKPGSVAGNTASIAMTASKIYNETQEGILKQSGLFDVKVNYQLPDETFTKIPVFVRNDIETKGPVKDIFNTMLTKSENRSKVNPDFIKAWEEGKIYDNAGKVIEPIKYDTSGNVISGKGITKSNMDIFEGIDTKLETLGVDTEGKDIFSLLKEQSEKPPIGSEAAKKLKAAEKLANPSKTSKAIKDITAPYTSGFEKGSSLMEKAGSAASIAAAAYGGYRVVKEEDPIEKVHGFVNMVTPYLMATGNPIAIGAVALHSIWDWLD